MPNRPPSSGGYGDSAYPSSSSFVSASDKEGDVELIGSSTAMMRLRLQLNRIGPHFRIVLLRGETGTGKELVARRLHRLSQGASRPFVSCHAGSLDDPLRGNAHATTQAEALDALTKGAEGGTLYLDGIEQLPPEAQAVLLRTLRRHEFAESGGRITQRLGSRIVVSTSQDLRILASAGRFGLELHQRLGTVEIALPPLRDRIEDIPQLVDHLLASLAARHGHPACSVSPEAMQSFLHYSWPGNEHELADLLRSLLMQREGGMIEAHHLPTFAQPCDASTAAPNDEACLRLEHVIERHVMRVLIDCGGNKLRAAERLGISRSTLYRMLDAGTTPHVSP